MPDAPCVLDVRSVAKRYGAVWALHDATFGLRSGEVLGLIGDNGAGKSTLVNIIAGTLQRDRGQLLVDGVEAHYSRPSEAQALGIETVFQHLSLIPTLDIAENIYLNRERYRAGQAGRVLRWMDRAGMRRDAMERLTELGLALPSARTKVAALSGGQRQAVAIGRAVLWGSHIVILDEPAAALGIRQTELVLSFIEGLKQRGIAVILISHNIEHIMRVCDRVVALRLGRVVGDVPIAETAPSHLVSLMTGAV